MAIFEITGTAITMLETTKLAEHGIQERQDLQRLLRESIDIVAPGCMVLAEEFCDWGAGKRRIDLLCLDPLANLVVIELKRGEDGGHADLQAIRYAAMVSTMSFDDAVGTHAAFAGLAPENAEEVILKHLKWDVRQDDLFNPDVILVLVSADFSKEVTATALWLIGHGIDAHCVRLAPHTTRDKRVLLDVTQIIPVPEAKDYQIPMGRKSALARGAVRERGAPTGYLYMNVGDSNHRSWEDCQKYGFMMAGHGEDYARLMQRLRAGDKLLAYLNGEGYVGVGTVAGPAVPQSEFIVASMNKKLIDLPLQTPPDPQLLGDPMLGEWCVPVVWEKTVARGEAVRIDFSHRGTMGQIRRAVVVAAVREALGLQADTV